MIYFEKLMGRDDASGLVSHVATKGLTEEHYITTLRQKRIFWIS